MCMLTTKVELSKEELLLVTNTTFILTKNRIVQKAVELFGEINETYKLLVQNKAGLFASSVLAVSGKIYKGEQYRELPYVMLDYPRFFQHNDALAIRSLFWWGKFFSITLHLSGTCKIMYQEKILVHLTGDAKDWFICISESPWQHHFEEDNYLPAAHFSTKELSDIIFNKPFVKLAKKLPVEEWNHAAVYFKNMYAAILEMME